MPRLPIECNGTRLAAWTLAILAITIAQADQIELSDGRSVSGKIQRESAGEVIVEGPSGTHTISPGQIVDVRYDGQGATMTRARIREEAHDLGRAADDYATAQNELSGKPLILLAARFGELRTRAQQAIDEQGPLNSIIASLEQFTRDQPDSRHHFPGQRLLGTLYFAQSDHAKAAGAFDALAKAPWLEARWTAAIYHARIQLAQQKPDQALQRLEPILAAAAESRPARQLLTEAWFEKAAVHRQRNERSQEIDALIQVIERAADYATALEPDAYAALGDAYRAADKPKDALVAFLHIELLFANRKDVHPRALYNLSQLWKELGRPDRSDQAQSTLKNEYPNSSWTKKLAM